jgi:hypothetical protein
MMSHDCGLKLNPPLLPPLITFQHKSLTPSPFQNDITNHDCSHKSQGNELCIESSCSCLKTKHWPICTILLMQKIIKTVCAIHAYWKHKRILSTHSTAGELPNWSMRSLASSAQNHTGYSKTFVSIVLQGSNPSVIWASPGMSDSTRGGKSVTRTWSLGTWSGSMPPSLV